VPYRFDPSGIEWVDETTGHRISLDGVGDLVDEMIDTTSEDTVDEILDILSDEPTEDETRQWKSAFWILLKHLYVALALVAAAGALTVGDFENVQVLLLLQLGYLDRFAQEVADGAVSRAEAGRRMRMYVNSARSAFWTVLDRQMADVGYTQERWHAIGDANTCSPCWEGDLMGWQPIGTFAEPGSGYVLRDPTTECQGLTHCRCRKSYRRGPR
jgi:hypothetical protein